MVGFDGSSSKDLMKYVVLIVIFCSEGISCGKSLVSSQTAQNMSGKTMAIKQNLTTKLMFFEG